MKLQPTTIASPHILWSSLPKNLLGASFFCFLCSSNCRLHG